MPKLPFKRTPASEPVVLDAYIPSEVVDYTVLPPLENEEAETGLRRLPKPLFMTMLVLPLLVVGLGAWALWGYFTNTPEPAVVLTPSVTINSARVVSSDAIMVEAYSQNVPDGTPVYGQVLAGEDPVDWIDTTTVSTTVRGGRISLRLQKSDPELTLDPQTTYRAAVNVGEGMPVASAQSDIAVPLQIANAFYAVATPTPVPPTRTPAPSATPTPSSTPGKEPTPVPSAEPSLAPLPVAGDDSLTMDVKLTSTVLIRPTVGSTPIGQIEAGMDVVPIKRSDDSQWLLVRHMEGDNSIGWLQAKDVNADNDAIARVRSVKPNAADIDNGQHKAQVTNGGNIRYTPSVQNGRVLGQMHGGQTVAITGKSSDGVWYYVLAPDAEGWVHNSLLTVSNDVAAQVPVAK